MNGEPFEQWFSKTPHKLVSDLDNASYHTENLNEQLCKQEEQLKKYLVAV